MGVRRLGLVVRNWATGGTDACLLAWCLKQHEN
jgi:hypothetical protein